MNKKQFLINLIQGNFIRMINNGDIRELTEFGQNFLNMRDLLTSMNANEEMLNIPAHIEQLEASLSEMIRAIIEGIEGQRAEIELKVELKKNGTLKVGLESMFTQDDYELSIGESMYNYSVSKIRRSGNSKREILGSLSQKQIKRYAEEDNYGTVKKHAQKIFLDDLGFAIKDVGITQIGEERHKKTITRDNMQIISGSTDNVKWSGNPLCLNSNDVSNEERYAEAMYTVLRCPSSKGYYVDLLGQDFEDFMQKLWEQAKS